MSFKPLTHPDEEIRIESLRNVGGMSAELLHDVGVHTLADLKAMGAVDIYVKLKRRHHHKVNKMFLYAMQGALLDVHWHALGDEIKNDLLIRVEQELAKVK